MTETTTQRLLDALSSPVRREILWLVWDRELAAGEIASSFDLGAATISEHLRALRHAGLVTLRVDGTFRRYRADRSAVAVLRPQLREDERKWFARANPRPIAPGRTSAVVVVETDAECDQAEAFLAFTHPGIYRRWAGIPVSLADGHFAAEMEWGLRVRGTYDYIVEPSLIVMNWDFEADQVPVPGAGRRAYLEITPRVGGCHLELHQLVGSEKEANYMERAWGGMLARFRDGVRNALDHDVGPAPRPRRRPGAPR